MIISNTLGWIIIIGLSLAVTGASFWLLYGKLKMSEKSWGLALLPGGILGVILYSNTTCVIDVQMNGTVNTFMGFTSGEYLASDGQQVAVSKKGYIDTYIINGSDRTMALESVAYGQSFLFFNTGPELIEPHTVYEIGRTPDYYPDELPPGSVSVSKGSKGTTKYWLRFATMEDLQE